MADLVSERNNTPLFTFSIYSMDEELYYHRIFLRPCQDVSFPRTDDPLVKYGPLTIFVVEAIDFFMSKYFGIEEWPVPMDMVQLRMDFPDKIYFNTMIGRAMCHECTVNESCYFAVEEGFDVAVWVQQTPSGAAVYTAKYLEIIRQKTRPVNISILNMLTFASHLVFEAFTSDNLELADAACLSTILLFQRVFPYEWIYWNTRLWSLTFNATHNDLHGSWQPGNINHNLA